MNRTLITCAAITLLMVSSPAMADLFISPYGNFSFFKDVSSHATLVIETPVYSDEIAASRLDNAPGGGVMIGTKSASNGSVFALNVEYLGGTSSGNSYSFTLADKEYATGRSSIQTPALALGGFVGGSFSGGSSSNFETVVGIEVGVLMMMGSVDLTYYLPVFDENNASTMTTHEESVDLNETPLYVNFLITENYAFGDMFGLTGTLGWRSVDTKTQVFESESLSGSYVVEYGGFFARFGLNVNF